MIQDPIAVSRDLAVLIVPGIGNSGPSHWQSLWEQGHPLWRRVRQRDWDHPVCDEWVIALDAAIAGFPAPPVLIAHSIGCLVVAHWICRFSAPVKAAFLAAVPDPESPNFPMTARGFRPVPLVPFPFPSLVVASTDGPFGSVIHAERCAVAWGGAFVEIGSAGHINVDSGYGDWPGGLVLLQKLLTSTK
jgi:predicted alpha/beta hydrolase family esterase